MEVPVVVEVAQVAVGAVGALEAKERVVGPVLAGAWIVDSKQLEQVLLQKQAKRGASDTFHFDDNRFTKADFFDDVLSDLGCL